MYSSLDFGVPLTGIDSVEKKRRRGREGDEGRGTGGETRGGEGEGGKGTGGERTRKEGEGKGREGKGVPLTALCGKYHPGHDVSLKK